MGGLSFTEFWEFVLGKGGEEWLPGGIVVVTREGLKMREVGVKDPTIAKKIQIRPVGSIWLIVVANFDEFPIMG